MKKQQFIAGAMMIVLVFCAISCELDGDNFRTLPSDSGPKDIPEKPVLFPEILQENPELTKEWWHYVLSYGREENPLTKPEIVESYVESDALVFVPDAKLEQASRVITVRTDQALIVPILNTIKTYPCEGLPPMEGQKLVDYLIGESSRFINGATNVSATLDDEPIVITKDLRIATDVFLINANPELAGSLDYCLNKEEQKAASAGYWLVLSGLEKGDHTLITHAEVPDRGVVQEVEYKITVE